MSDNALQVGQVSFASASESAQSLDSFGGAGASGSIGEGNFGALFDKVPSYSGDASSAFVLSDGTTMSVSASSSETLSSKVVDSLVSMRESGVSAWDAVDEKMAEAKQLSEAKSDSPEFSTDNMRKSMTAILEVSRVMTLASLDTTMKTSTMKKAGEDIQQLVRAQ